MISILVSAVVFWIIWRVLDSVFSRRVRPAALKPGDYLKEINGELYLVRDIQSEPEELPEELPSNVVRFKENNG
jgi:hypothetical protein